MRSAGPRPIGARARSSSAPWLRLAPRGTAARSPIPWPRWRESPTERRGRHGRSAARRGAGARRCAGRSRARGARDLGCRCGGVGRGPTMRRRRACCAGRWPSSEPSEIGAERRRRCCAWGASPSSRDATRKALALYTSALALQDSVGDARRGGGDGGRDRPRSPRPPRLLAGHGRVPARSGRGRAGRRPGATDLRARPPRDRLDVPERAG